MRGNKVAGRVFKWGFQKGTATLLRYDKDSSSSYLPLGLLVPCCHRPMSCLEGRGLGIPNVKTLSHHLAPRYSAK